MESALGPDMRRVLAESCQLLSIPSDRWHLSPAFARYWETMAVARLAGRLATESGLAHKSAVDAAAIRLGLSPDTPHSRLGDWPRDAILRAA